MPLPVNKSFSASLSQYAWVKHFLSPPTQEQLASADNFP